MLTDVNLTQQKFGTLKSDILRFICFQYDESVWQFGGNQLPWVVLDEETLQNYEDMAYSFFHTGTGDDDAEDEDSDDYENVSDDDYEECSKIEIDMEPNGFSNTCSADDFRWLFSFNIEMYVIYAHCKFLHSSILWLR